MFVNTKMLDVFIVIIGLSILSFREELFTVTVAGNDWTLKKVPK